MEKLTKAQERELKKLAEALPPQNYTAYHGTILGADLIKANPEVTEPGGKPIRPKQLYKKPVELPVNHFNRLKNAWKSGGVKAAQAYIDKLLPPVESKK